MRAPILNGMKRNRNGLFPFVLPALVLVPVAGIALGFLSLRWFHADSRAALNRRVVDTAAAVSRQLDSSVQRQAAATRALATSPMAWIWVKFQGERLSPSNRSHAQLSLDELDNYAGLLPGVTLSLASQRTRTVYQGGAAVAALSQEDPRDAWYAASLATEGVLVSAEPRALRTSMRVMNGREMLGAVSCVSDVGVLASSAFDAAAEEPGFSLLLADAAGAVVTARGAAAAAVPVVFDMFSPSEKASVRAMMDEVVRPGSTSLAVLAARGRRVLTSVTRTAAPGWFLFVSAELPRVPAVRTAAFVGISAAALLLLAAALFFIARGRAREAAAFVSRLTVERDSAAQTVKDVGAAAVRLRAAAGILRERAAALAAEASEGRQAGAAAANLLDSAAEASAELRSGIETRIFLLDELSSSAREAVEKSREARSSEKAVGQDAASAAEELNRVITTGSAVSLSVESALKGVEAVVEAAERARLLALNAGLEASRSGGHGGARAADEMRRLAEEAAARAGELASFLSEARDGMRIVGRAAREAGNAIHRVGAGSEGTGPAFDAAWRGASGMLSRIDAARASAERLRDDARLSDHGRSAVDGVGKIMARVEALCAEIAALAAAVSTESATAARKTASGADIS
jgi:methyl-accepting chemotaxis protein